MSQFLGIPIPSAEQIIVGTELVFILYIPKRVVAKLDGEFRRERNLIIHRHVKTGHEGRLKHCADDLCASLKKQAPTPLQVQELSEVVDIDL